MHHLYTLLIVLVALLLYGQLKKHFPTTFA